MPISRARQAAFDILTGVDKGAFSSDLLARHTSALDSRDAGLAEEIELPFVRPGVRHIFNQYVIRVGRQRDALRVHLNDSGVGSEIYYPVPLHLQKCFAYLGYKTGDLPLTEAAAAETVALPMCPELTDAQQDYVVSTVAKFFR